MNETESKKIKELSEECRRKIPMPQEVKIVRKHIKALTNELASVGFSGYFEYDLTNDNDVPVVFCAISFIEPERYKASNP